MKEKETSTSKRVYFTYVGKETQFMKELHKNCNVNLSYKTYNTIPRFLAYKQLEYNNKYSGNGMYALARPDCGKQYMGQTDSLLGPDLQNIFSLIYIKMKIPNFRNIIKRVFILFRP
jgi:hypothetical protein